jgi:hypothetical protein
MSEATVRTLTASIYDRLIELDITHDLDNEQIRQVARAAAQTIEDAGTVKAIVRAWLTANGFHADQIKAFVDGCYRSHAERWGDAIREVQS